MLNLSDNPLVFLLLVNIFLLLVGTVLDGIAALIILVPVMMPLLATYQIDPVHFGVIICINLTIGLLTPPVGTGLFIVSSIAKGEIRKTSCSRYAVFRDGNSCLVNSYLLGRCSDVDS